MTARRFTVACVAATCVTTAGCGSGERASAPKASESATATRVRASSVRADSWVTCANHVEPTPSAATRRAMEKGATVVPLSDGGRLVFLDVNSGPGRSTLEDRRAWGWKVPVSLTADRSVVVSLADRTAPRARLGFTAERRPTTFGRGHRATRFTSCPPDTPTFSKKGTVGPVTGWAGSVTTLDRRVCLRLRATSEGETVRFKLPLGKRCPS